MTTHRFTVEVTGCTTEEAEQVIAERIGYDEDYGFEYQINWQSIWNYDPAGQPKCAAGAGTDTPNADASAVTRLIEWLNVDGENDPESVDKRIDQALHAIQNAAASRGYEMTWWTPNELGGVTGLFDDVSATWEIIANNSQWKNCISCGEEIRLLPGDDPWAWQSYDEMINGMDAGQGCGDCQHTPKEEVTP